MLPYSRLLRAFSVVSFPGRFILALVPILLALPLFTFGQAPAPTVAPAEEKILELSPFVITADSNVGYAATSTLAGTRIKTDLKDLGSAISVITPEFLADTGATNLEDLLSFTLGTEIGGMQGNFSGADLGGSSQRYDLDEQRREPQAGARVRGISAPNFTRGYFSTSIPIDSYNTGGITISRGANSLLFGLGSAAGVVESGLSQATLGRNAYEVSSRVGSYGTHRESFKINQVLIKNRLALQIAGLNKAEQYRQDPAEDNERRVYASLEAALFKGTQNGVVGRTALRGSVEYGKGDRTPPTALPPLLAWQSFFEAPQDFRPYTGQDYLQTYDWLARNWTKWRTIDSRRIPVTATTFRPGWYESPITAAQQGYPQLLAPVHSTPHIFAQVALAYPAGASAPSLGTGNLAGFQGWIAAPNQQQSPHLATRAYNDGPQGTGFKSFSLTNREVFDFEKQLLTGDQQDIRRKFDAQVVTLEQQLFKGRAGIEATYGREEYRLDYYQPFGGAARDLSVYIDTTEYLSNGAPNPHVGRAFSYSIGDREQWRLTKRENMRATAFADVDFEQIGLTKGIGKWLGRHRFTGLWQRESRETTGLNYNTFWSGVGFDYIRTVAGANNNNWTAGDLQVFPVVYLSGDLRGVEAKDVRLTPMAINRVQNGDTHSVRYLNRITNQFETGTVRANRLAIGGTANRADVTSEALAWQSYLIDRSLVGLVGWRTDRIENFRQVRTNSRSVINEYLPDNLEISDSPATEQNGDTFTWSLVGHVPARFVRKLPAVSSASLHYSQAENFSATDERHDIFNRALPNPQGTTKEYGFSLGFAENKWSLKVNRFETNSRYASVLGAETAAGVSEFTNRWLTGYETGYDNQTTYPIQSLEIFRRGYTTYDQFFSALINAIPEPVRSIYAPFRNAQGNWTNRDTIRGLTSTSDIIAKGWETELTANPLPNWRLSMNLVKLGTVRANTGQALLDYSNQVMDNLAKANLLGVVEGVASIVPFETRFNQQVITGLRGERAKDGAVSQEARKWRANLVTNYDFRQGRLRGFGAGAGVRWQSKVATGYEVTLDARGNQVPVVSRPFLGSAELNGDLWFSYGRKLTEKVSWKVQLNVRNVIGSGELIPVYTNPDGRTALYRIAPDRNWFLTNTFSF